MKSVVVFQHVAHEILGTLHPLLRAAGFRIRHVNFGRHPDTTVDMSRYDRAMAPAPGRAPAAPPSRGPRERQGDPRRHGKARPPAHPAGPARIFPVYRTLRNPPKVHRSRLSDLARISHRVSAAATDLTGWPLRFGRAEVLPGSTYRQGTPRPLGPPLARPAGHLRRLATKPCEKCGLAPN